ncbi:Paraplegin [Lamellibrachia satsuma]|nr:Paraplegin [Lamellibrachia satsuma]
MDLADLLIAFPYLQPRNKISTKWHSYKGCESCARRQLSGNYVTYSRARLLEKEARAFATILDRSRLTRTEDVARLCGVDSFRLFSTSRVLAQYKGDGEQDDKEQNENEEQPEEERMPFLARLMLMVWLGFLLYVVVRLQAGEETGLHKFVSWNEFVHDMLAKGEVEEIVVRPEAEITFIKLYDGAIIKGQQVGPEVYSMKIVDPYKFEDKLRRVERELGIKPEQGIPISYQRESSWGHIVFIAIVAVAVYLIFKNLVKIQLPNPTDMFASERKAKFQRVDLTSKGKGVSFKDVAGMHEAKMEVLEFVDFLKYPERYTNLGGKIPHGALLLGPPGCGKTLLARAVATEAKVPFLAMAGSEFVEMLGGLGAARVRDLFKEARRIAPCIIYIDEIDAIGRRRQGSGGAEGSEEEHTLNQLLVEMDGMSTKEGVIMLGSTNRPDVLDKALLRPGRFDRHIEIDLPNLSERTEIFEVFLQRLRLLKAVSTYSNKLAQLSPGMSGADIANICNEAALHAAREVKHAVEMADFDYAVERVIAGTAKRSRVLTQQEKKVVAFHEAGHAVTGWLLEHTDSLLKVSIVPRTNAALGFAQYTTTDKKLYSEVELMDRMCMGLGGRVAESIIFNRITSGAHDDLQKVTKNAYAQVRQLGMNSRIGPVSYNVGAGDQTEFQVKPYSKNLGLLIDEESRHLVAKAYKLTEQLLLKNREKLRVVAEALLEKETLSYKDMEQLIGPRPFTVPMATPVNWMNPDVPRPPTTM